MLPEAGQGGEEPWLRESSSLGDFASAHERSESNQRTITGFILLLGAREQLEKSQIDISQEKHCTSQLPYCDTALECDDFQGSNTILLYIQALQARRNAKKEEKKRKEKTSLSAALSGGVVTEEAYFKSREARARLCRTLKLAGSLCEVISTA